MSMPIHVSFGEVLDKITILEIKAERISDTAKLTNVKHELKALERSWAEAGLDARLPKELRTSLKAINEALWDIEDQIRDKEFKGEFDEEFIELARSVYFTNDERAKLKRDVNQALGSAMVEEKSYHDYKRT